MLLRISTLIALLVFLVGCSTIPSQRDEVNWDQERGRLARLTHWQLTGKMAIITSQQKGSARIFWQQQGDDYHLSLTSLVGTHILDVSAKEGQITLLDPMGRRHKSQDAPGLIYQLTGWHIPLTQLATWVKGIPGQAQFELNPDNSVARVREGDWQITYSDYRDQQGYRLPHILLMTGKDTHLKLQVNQWTLSHR